MLITSVNQISLEGRSSISPAIKHRCVHPQVKGVKEYSEQSLEEIILHWMLRDGEEDVEIPSAEERAKKSQRATEIASDFKYLLAMPGNDHLSLRSLRSALPEILQECGVSQAATSQLLAPIGLGL